MHMGLRLATTALAVGAVLAGVTPGSAAVVRTTAAVRTTTASRQQSAEAQNPANARMHALSRPLDSKPAGGLAVYTTPDPTPASSTAYIYSPVVLPAAPRVTVTDPAGHRSRVTAVLDHAADPGQWYRAPLPGGAAGTNLVAATATTKDGQAVRGSSSYQVLAGDTGRGPQWNAVGPNSMGGILAVDPTRPADLYMASGLAPEVFASRDRGASWKMQRTLPVAAGYPTAMVATRGRLILSVNGGNGLYVADPTYMGKVFESSDDGAHWRDLQLPDEFVETVLVAADGTIVAVTKNAIEITSDDGAHWRSLPVPWTSYTSASLVGDDLYVGAFTGLYVVKHVSADSSGPTVAFLPGGRSNWIVGVAGDSDSIYAAAWAGGIFVSHDSGATWSHCSDPPGFVLSFTDVAGTVYAQTGTSLWVGTDDGAHWETRPDAATGSIDQTLAAIGKTVYVSTWESGLYSTTDDGAHYRRLGVAGVDVYGVAVTGDQFVAGTEWDTYRSTLSRLETLRPDSLEWGHSGAESSSNGVIPLVSAGAERDLVYKVRSGPRIGTFTVYASHDAGASWQSLYSGYGGADALWVDGSSIYVSSTSGASGATLQSSHDGGKTWAPVSLPAPAYALVGDGGTLWFGGPSGLWRSVDGGATFVQQHTSAVSALAVLPDHRLIVGGARLSISGDGGRSLVAARQPKLDFSVTALVADPRHPAVVYAGTGPFYEAGLRKGGHGVFRSTDGGVTWQPFSAGLTDLDVSSLAITADGQHLYAGTLRGGVFGVAPYGCPSGSGPTHPKACPA